MQNRFGTNEAQGWDSGGGRLREQRSCIAEMLDDVRHLGGRDRVLVQAVYRRGLTASDFATVTGQDARTIRRQLNRIMRRLRSPLFRFVVRERVHWPPLRREIAEAVVLRGEVQRMVAQRLNVPLHRVRHEIWHVRALSETAIGA
jgi:hypothetical protein